MAEGEKTVVSNRKARHEYDILETFEAGIVLQGTEVKSMRLGKVNLGDAYARIKDGEVFLVDMHISPYEQGNIYNHDPLRPRKLLLHKREIKRLTAKVQERGLTLIPLRVYFKNGIAKVELALAKGKKIYDRREDIKRRDEEREWGRRMRGKVKF